MPVPDIVLPKKGTIASRYLEAISCGGNDVSALSMGTPPKRWHSVDSKRARGSGLASLNDSSCGMTDPTAPLDGSASWTTLDTRAARSIDTRSKSDGASRSSWSRGNVRRIHSMQTPISRSSMNAEDESSIESIPSPASRRRGKSPRTQHSRQAYHSASYSPHGVSPGRFVSNNASPYSNQTSPQMGANLSSPYQLGRAGTLGNPRDTVASQRVTMGMQQPEENTPTEVMHNLSSTRRYPYHGYSIDQQMGFNDSEAGAPTEVMTNKTVDVYQRAVAVPDSEAGAPTEVMTNKTMDVLQRIHSNANTKRHLFPDKVNKSLFDDTSTQESSTVKSIPTSVPGILPAPGGLDSASTTSSSRLEQHMSARTPPRTYELQNAGDSTSLSYNTGTSSNLVETGGNRPNTKSLFGGRPVAQFSGRNIRGLAAARMARLQTIRGLRQQEEQDELEESPLYHAEEPIPGHPVPEDKGIHQPSTPPSSPHTGEQQQQQQHEQQQPLQEALTRTALQGSFASHTTSDTDALLQAAANQNENSLAASPKKFIGYNDRKQENADEVFQKRKAPSEASSSYSSMQGEEQELGGPAVSGVGEQTPIQQLYTLDRVDFSMDSQSPLRKWKVQQQQRALQMHPPPPPPPRRDQRTPDPIPHPLSISLTPNEHVLSPVSYSTAEGSIDHQKGKTKSKEGVVDRVWPSTASSHATGDMIEEELVQIMDRSRKNSMPASAPSPPAQIPVSHMQSSKSVTPYTEQQVVREQLQIQTQSQQQLQLARLSPVATPLDDSVEKREAVDTSVRDKIKAFNAVPPDQWNGEKPPLSSTLKFAQRNVNRAAEEKKTEEMAVDLRALELQLSKIERDDDDTGSVRSLREVWERKTGGDDHHIFEDTDEDTMIDDDDRSVKSLRDKLEKKHNNTVLDDDDGSVKSLRERFDAPPKRDNEKVSRMRALFESKDPKEHKPTQDTQKRRLWSSAIKNKGQNRQNNDSDPGLWNHQVTSTSQPEDNAIEQEDEGDFFKSAGAGSAWKSNRRRNLFLKPKSKPAPTQPFAKKDRATSSMHDRLNRWASRHQVSKSKVPLASQELGQQEQNAYGLDRMESYDLSSVVDEDENDEVVNHAQVEAALQRASASFFSRTNKEVKQKQDILTTNLKTELPKTRAIDGTDVSNPLASTGERDDNKNQIFRRESEGEDQSNRAPGSHWVQSEAVMPHTDDTKRNSIETEYSDGVTLDISVAEVSLLTNPSAIHSKSSKEENQLEPKASEDSSAIELAAKKSEASSSQQSEAAAPLLTTAMRENPMSDELSRDVKRQLIGKAHKQTSPKPPLSPKPPPTKTPEIPISQPKPSPVAVSSNKKNAIGWDINAVSDSFPDRTPSSDNLFETDSNDAQFPEMPWPASFDQDNAQPWNSPARSTTSNSGNFTTEPQMQIAKRITPTVFPATTPSSMQRHGTQALMNRKARSTSRFHESNHHITPTKRFSSLRMEPGVNSLHAREMKRTAQQPLRGQSSTESFATRRNLSQNHSSSSSPLGPGAGELLHRPTDERPKNLSTRFAEPILSSSTSSSPARTLGSRQITPAQAPTPTSLEEDYGVIMEARHKMLVSRQRAHAERRAARENMTTEMVKPVPVRDPSSADLIDVTPSLNRIPQQRGFFGRTNPSYRATDTRRPVTPPRSNPSFTQAPISWDTAPFPPRTVPEKPVISNDYGPVRKRINSAAHQENHLERSSPSDRQLQPQRRVQPQSHIQAQPLSHSQAQPQSHSQAQPQSHHHQIQDTSGRPSSFYNRITSSLGLSAGRNSSTGMTKQEEISSRLQAVKAARRRRESAMKTRTRYDTHSRQYNDQSAVSSYRYEAEQHLETSKSPYDMGMLRQDPPAAFTRSTSSQPSNYRSRVAMEPTAQYYGGISRQQRFGREEANNMFDSLLQVD